MDIPEKIFKNVEGALISLAGRNIFKTACKLLKNNHLLYCREVSENGGNGEGIINYAIEGAFTDKEGNIIKTRVNFIDRMFSEHSLNGFTECSCGKNTSGIHKCEHIIALLFHFISEKKEVKNLLNETKCDVARYAGLTFKKLDELMHLFPESKTAKLVIKTTYTFPHAPSKWEKVFFNISLLSYKSKSCISSDRKKERRALLCDNREKAVYSEKFPDKNYVGNIGNLRQLFFNKRLGVSLKLEDFSLQEQQIIRFLAINGEQEDDSRISLNAEQTAELFHSLVGFDNFILNKRKINIRKETASPLLLVINKNGLFLIRPAVVIDNTVLPLSPKNVRIIAGRTGCWLGVSGEYWWIPALVDISWLRNFLKSEAQILPTEKINEFIRLQRRFPVKLLITDSEPELRPVSCKPYIDCTLRSRSELLLTLKFEYDGVMFSHDGLLLAPLKRRIVRRDNSEEQKFINRLRTFGFKKISVDRIKFLPVSENNANNELKERICPPSPTPGSDTALPKAVIKTENSEIKFILYGEEAIGVFFDKVLTSWIRNGTIASLSANTTGIYSSSAGGMAYLDIKCRFIAYEGDYVLIEYKFYAKGAELNICWDTIYDKIKKGGAYLIRVSSDKELILYIPETIRNFFLAIGDVVSPGKDKNANNILQLPRYLIPFWISKANDISGLIPKEFYTYDTSRPKTISFPEETARSSSENNLSLNLFRFQGTLREYQLFGVAWLKSMAEKSFNPILADEMGLGKTVQTLALLSLWYANSNIPNPSLIVCPTTLMENWMLEIRRFIPAAKACVANSRDRKNIWKNYSDYHIIVTSYSIVLKDIKIIRGIHFFYLILDEAQHIKNISARTTGACKAISAVHKLILTGTPIENSVEELWSLTDFLHPNFLGDYFKKIKIRNRSNSGKGSDLILFKEKIAPFILRRKKEDVCKELPEKVEQIVYCEMFSRQRILYNKILRQTKEEFKILSRNNNKNIKFKIFTQLLRLRQICCHPALLPEDLKPENSNIESAKTQLLFDILEDALSSERKILLFSQFTSMLSIIKTQLDLKSWKYEYLDGDVPAAKRHERIKNFSENKDIKLFLLSLKTGGFGLNLTEADTVIIYDPWWNPAVEEQAMARVHRIGQKKNVLSIKLAIKDSIEEKILKLQTDKQILFNELIENNKDININSISIEDIEYLLK